MKGLTKELFKDNIPQKNKVSIIIPCYNCEKYVLATLDSLEIQTYRNIEVVCVNDGSTDSTLTVLNNFKNRGNITTIIVNQENGGVSSARNRGIQASSGKYIMFCDADDCYHKNMVEILVNSLENSNTDTAYCLYRRNEKCLNTPIKSTQSSIKNQTDAMRDLLYRMGEIGVYCYIYKKEILVNHSILFDCNTRHFEDREFNWKYLVHCETATFVNCPLYWYRKTENSATTTRVVKWRTDSIDAVKRVEDYLNTNNVPFLEELKTYLYQRVIFSLAKNYAVAGKYDLFVRLGKEYDVKPCMKVTFHDKNKMVAIFSAIYIISPRLFYLIVKLLGKYVS